jgi:hypothetical protein
VKFSRFNKSVEVSSSRGGKVSRMFRESELKREGEKAPEVVFEN